MREARAARICDLYADWCGNWGMDANMRAACEGARECAKMIRLLPDDIALPDDDEQASDLIIKWLQTNKIDTRPESPSPAVGDGGEQ